MAKQIIGKINEFDPEAETFENYTERLENFLKINSIKEEDKVGYFISIMGPRLYSTLKNLLLPKSPGETSFRDILKVLKAHYWPKRNVAYERFLFNKRNQKEGETIANYAIQLKQLASTCNFETFLEDALRDRFICGLRSSLIQSKLLAEGDSLTFDKALEMALVVENAESNVRSLHPGSSGESNEISFVKANQSHARKQFTSRPSAKSKFKPCFRCGKEHDCKTCPYKDFECHSCKKKGHLAKVCFRSKGRPRFKPRINYCNEDSDEEPSEENTNGFENQFELYTIAYSNDNRPTNFVTELKVNGVPLPMVIDTGAVVTVLPDVVYVEKFQQSVPQLSKSKICLKTYTGEKISVLGEFQALVESEGQKELLPMVVVKSTAPNQPVLIGRNWLERLKLDWNKVSRGVHGSNTSNLNKLNGKTVHDFSSTLLEDCKKKYSNVFDVAFGEVKNVSVELVLKENVKPIFCKPHNVPFALRPAVERELDSLVENGVIYPVTQSEWATPVVVVPKADNSVRICGNFKITLNQCLRTDHYPLPNPDEIFAQIAGAKFFSKIDLASAYNQVKVKESSQELLTINTFKGLFRYQRLPYGISSAGSIFQSVMDKILHGIRNTYSYLDDILLISSTQEEMIDLVHEVLCRLNEFGVKVNEEKSEFLKTSVIFLGHLIDGTGIHPSPELTRAIVEAPRPTDITQLRAYLGLLNYYGKFLPNLSTLLHPLHQLLNSGIKWEWDTKCEEAFAKSKKLLLKNNVLMPFDPRLDIIVTCDSSKYGVGAVMAHVLPDGVTERPIAFASRTLTKCEAKYAQIEKEALALVFAVKKFHVFLYGRRFKLVTDHRALVFIFNSTKAVPTLSAARIQRWALILSTYQYDLVYRQGAQIPNADALSRLPCSGCSSDEGEINFFSSTYSLPITYKEIGLATKFDPTLSKVVDFTLNGWPSHFDDALKPFSDKVLQLSVEQNCLLWGSRVVIPPTHRREILLLLHSEHPGESRMKSLARSYLWWPNMDRDIQQFVSECKICQCTRKSAPVVPLQPWSWPTQNWQRLHLDFAKFEGQDFLILVDSSSKWVEIFHMRSTTSEKTIEKLRSCFAAFGLPHTVVTDGGPQFTSSEFNEFLKANGVNHVLTPPYHPASNGLAERMVQTVKESFLKQLLHDQKNSPNRTIQHKIDSFLFVYRNTPHSITGCSPSEILFKKKPRTPLTLLKPHLVGEMEKKQLENKSKADCRRGRERAFEVGDKIFVRTVRQEKLNWLPGVVIRRISPVTYVVKEGKRNRFVHADHLKKNFTKEEPDEELVVLAPKENFESTDRPTPPRTPEADPAVAKEIEEVIPPPVSPVKPKSPEKPSPGRPQRARRKPQRLDL